MKTAVYPLIAMFALVSVLAAKDDADGELVKKLEGTWQLTSAMKDGKAVPEETVNKIRVVIKDGKHSVYFGDDPIVKEIAFKIDASAKPYKVTDTLPDGKFIKSIFKLEGDTLTSCVAEPGQDYPKEFSAKEGSGNTLRVFKRAKK